MVGIHCPLWINRPWVSCYKQQTGVTAANNCAKSFAAEGDVCLCIKHTKRCSSMYRQKAAKQIKSQQHESWEWRGRLLAFHWALASHVVRVAVVHLQFPPWFRVGVHCGRGGQWRAMVCLYMHLKVGRSGETWDQRNKEQGSCLTHSGFDHVDDVLLQDRVSCATY